MRKLAAAVLLGSVALASSVVPADALGTRIITSVPAVVLSSTLGSATLTGTMSVVVTETAVTGVSPWSVSVSMSALTKSGAPSIANSNVVIMNRAVAQVGGGGTSTPGSGAEILSNTRTLHTTTGQSALGLYTGTYTDTATLSVSLPNGQNTGQYLGTMTITLVQ
jgi:hypothetical protein